MQQNYENILQNKLETYLSVSKTSTDNALINKHSAQLTTFSHNPHFLDTAYSLLINPHSSTPQRKDYQILLTSLIKDKFKYEFETIHDKADKHYQQLCDIAKKLKNANQAIVSNIGLALAYIYLYLIGTHEISLQSFMNPLQPTDKENHKLYSYYFKTLQNIAFEIENSRFVIDEVQRDKGLAKISAQQVLILQGLDKVSTVIFGEYPASKEHILNCFEAWIAVHYDADIMNNIPNHSLFQKALQVINDEECGEAASNCLRSIIYRLKNPVENKPLYDTLSNCTLQLIELIQKNIKEMDIEKADQFLRIIADFARKSKELFVEKYDINIQGFLKKLIEYLRDDLLSSYQTLADVFEDLFKYLQQLRSQSRCHINPEIYKLLDPLYQALCYKCQIPLRIIKELNQTRESSAHHLSASAQEIFKHRDFTEDLFKLIGQIQGKVNYLHFVYPKIQTLDPSNQKTFWPKLQIYLSSLMDAIKDYPKVDEVAINLVHMYYELQKKEDNKMHICVQRAFLRVFRSLVRSEQKNLEFVYEVMRITVHCFNSPLVSYVAQKAFSRCCEEYTSSAAPIFSEFAGNLQKYPDRQYIVKGISVLICSDETLMKEYLGKLFQFLFEKFISEQDKERKKINMYSLLAALKSFQDSPCSQANMGILVQFVRQNWIAIKTSLANPTKLKDDQDTDIQRVVRILKTIMRILDFHFSEFLQDLFTTVLSAFQKYPICSYVYLVQIAVTVYSSNSAYNTYLQRLYSDFCVIAFQHMKNIQDISRFCYLLDDFTGMNKRFFVYNPSIVLSSGKLPWIIDLCINNFMGCEIPRVAKAAYSFFQTIFKIYWRQEFIQQHNSRQDIIPIVLKAEDSKHYIALKEYLLQKLESIIGKMLSHLSTDPSQITRDYILDALIAEIKAFQIENPPLWRNMLSNCPSDILVQNQKERMVQILESLTTADFETAKKKVKAFDKMLVLLNRRFMNSDRRKAFVY